jgi:dTDP-4-dehydrorhamnose 3,5-epimerase
MKFEVLPLFGACLIKPERRDDQRGSFARVFCAREFAAHGLETSFVQANISTNIRAGTVRGLHFQHAPYAEAKLVRCVRGCIYDALVDLRDDSPTYGHSFGAELSEINGLSMYVPPGFAHGYQTLTDGAAVHYLVSAFYAPDYEDGINHSDPSLAIRWPLPITAVSSKDALLPFLNREGQ